MGTALQFMVCGTGWLVAPSGAVAELGLLSFEEGSGALTCNLLPLCAGPEDCTALPGSECSSAIGQCVPNLRDRILCDCAEGADCPTRLGASAQCVLVGDASIHVCVYDLVDYCVDNTLAITDATVLACVTDGASGEASYSYGDCDGDGMPQSADPCPCDAENLCPAASPDAGVVDAGPADTGAPDTSVDGGHADAAIVDSAIRDTGTDPRDAAGDTGAEPQPDAAEPADTGADAPAAPRTPRTPMASFTGDGGCSVARTGPPATVALLLAWFALILTRRRLARRRL